MMMLLTTDPLILLHRQLRRIFALQPLVPGAFDQDSSCRLTINTLLGGSSLASLRIGCEYSCGGVTGSLEVGSSTMFNVQLSEW